MPGGTGVPLSFVWSRCQVNPLLEDVINIRKAALPMFGEIVTLSCKENKGERGRVDLLELELETSSTK